MNREIKFRVWDKEGKRWCPDYFGNNQFTLNQHFIDDRVIFQQFTGLLDENDKEIYEGDIIEIISKKKGYIKNFIIKYDEWGFCAYEINEIDKHNYKIHIFTYKGKTYSTVVGNIFENPEMLKK